MIILLEELALEPENYIIWRLIMEYGRVGWYI